jgi:hypothetical protein
MHIIHANSNTIATQVLSKKEYYNKLSFLCRIPGPKKSLKKTAKLIPPTRGNSLEH